MNAAEAAASGVPWQVVIIAIIASAIVSGIGTFATVRLTGRTAKATNEQVMIDQLQEETKSLRKDLTSLTAEVRILRVREIAWITHTSTLTQIVAMAGHAVPPLPEELRLPISVVHDVNPKES